jgi:phage-related protein
LNERLSPTVRVTQQTAKHDIDLAKSRFRALMDDRRRERR